MKPTSTASTHGGFPSTMWSEIISLRDPSAPEFRERLNGLILRYWKPVYQTIRSGWARHDEEAKDLTQEFFLLVFEDDILAAADPVRGSFRRYLRSILRHFLINQKRAERSLKRGGNVKLLSLDFDTAGPRLDPASGQDDPEKAFDRAWANQLLAEALRDLEVRLATSGKQRAFEIFLAYDAPQDSRPSCRELAERFSMADHEVRRTLEFVHDELRSILLRQVTEYVTDESELFRELDELFSL